MVTAVRHAMGVQPMVAGKPEPPLMTESVDRAGAVRPIVVGDRLDTDIEGAWRSGIPSILVLTGVTDWQDLLDARPEHRPTHLGRDLRALLEPPAEVDVQRGNHEYVGRCGSAAVRVPVEPPPAPGRTGVTTAGPRPTESADPGWWVPEGLRDAGRGGSAGLESIDLDVVRALVAVAWSISDSGARIRGGAHVDGGSL
jgi:hypothetical protein